MKRIALTLPILWLMLACGPADLQKVGNGINALAVATGTAENTLISMEQNKLLDTDTTRSILTALNKVDLAQKQAVSITRALTKLDKPTTEQLIGIMGPVTSAVQELVTNGTAGIKNPDTKAKVLAVLTSIQAVIAAINLSLGG